MRRTGDAIFAGPVLRGFLDPAAADRSPRAAIS
jgi:hypothetical protein